MHALLLRLGATAPGRFVATLLALALGLAGYLAVNGVTPPRLTLFTPVDEAIPFLPWTLVFYHSYYVLPLAVVTFATAAEFVMLIEASLVGVAVTFLCFLLIPANYPRPDWSVAGPFWGPAFQWLHGIDGPANTFPSLHVEITALAWMRTRRWPRAPLWGAWALLVILSTLTTKQHFVADVLSASGLAWWASKRVEGRSRDK